MAVGERCFDRIASVKLCEDQSNGGNVKTEAAVVLMFVAHAECQAPVTS